MLLASVLGLDGADKATVSAVAGRLKHAFGIGNTDIGIIISVSSFVGALLTLPVGSLVDRISQRNILIVVIEIRPDDARGFPRRRVADLRPIFCSGYRFQ
ncbi:MAG: hypothetical protein WCD20_16835 [Rhodomicrobium sp.]